MRLYSIKHKVHSYLGVWTSFKAVFCINWLFHTYTLLVLIIFSRSTSMGALLHQMKPRMVGFCPSELGGFRLPRMHPNIRQSAGLEAAAPSNIFIVLWNQEQRRHLLLAADIATLLFVPALYHHFLSLYDKGDAAFFAILFRYSLLVLCD